MLSDFEDEVRPAPVFKSKRKVNKGKRRIREVLGGDEEALAENSTFSNADIARNTQDVQNNKSSTANKIGLNPTAGPAVSMKARWARYSALSENNGEAESINKVENVSEDPQSAAIYTLPLNNNQEITNETHDHEVHEVHEHYVPSSVPENLAYKRVDIAPAAKTFRLQESHFRDSQQSFVPLEKEYADAYGNVSDEDEMRAEAATRVVKDDEDDIDDINSFDDIDNLAGPRVSGGADMKRSALGQFSFGQEPEGMHPRDLEMYDSEVSVEDGEPETAKMAEISEPEEILRQLIEKVAGLETGIQLKQAKAAQLKQMLAELQSQRQRVIESL